MVGRQVPDLMVGIGRIAQYGGGFGRIGRKGKIVNFIEAGKPVAGLPAFRFLNTLSTSTLF